MNAKEAAGKAAAELVKEGMVVGIGTGTTALHFINHLGKRCKEGLTITAIATSENSESLAKEMGIPLTDNKRVTQLDIAVDGADEIDEQNRMIKGGGGALTREKIVAAMAKNMVIIVDNSKLVKSLGTFPLAVEILRFGYSATIQRIVRLGLKGKLRLKNETLYITDNGNVIFDIHFPYPPENPEEIDTKLHAIPGVLETGFFFGLNPKVIIGYPDGHTEIRT